MRKNLKSLAFIAVVCHFCVAIACVLFGMGCLMTAGDVALGIVTATPALMFSVGVLFCATPWLVIYVFCDVANDVEAIRQDIRVIRRLASKGITDCHVDICDRLELINRNGKVKTHAHSAPPRG